jgi:adsorption protein B
LAEGLSEQAKVPYLSIDAYALAPELIATLPADIALHYAVLPIKREGSDLVVATESALSPIALSALRRKLGLNVEYVIAQIGQVTVGLRHCYARYRLSDPKETLNAAITFGRLRESDREAAWTYFVSRQVMLGEVLQTLGRIDAAAFSAVLLQHASSNLPLGEYLVENDIISQDTLAYAISVQADIQPSMEMVIERFENPTFSDDVLQPLHER